MHPSSSRVITIPATATASGDNVLIANPTSDPKWIHIKQIQLTPEGAVRMTFKAVHPVNGDRDFTSDTSYVSGQGFIFESFDTQSPYVFELHPGEAFVVELSAAVDCKGFINYTTIQ